jgi:hypothetical protein
MNRSTNMQGGVGGFTIETVRHDDGTFEAHVRGHADVRATGPTEPSAIQGLRKILDDKVARGDRL